MRCSGSRRPLHQFGERVLAAEEDALQIDVYRAVPFLFGDQMGAPGETDAGVVVKDVQTAKAAYGLGHHPLGIGGLGYVGMNRDRLASAIRDFGGDRACVVLGAVRYCGFAPSAANSSAVARPIPDPLPVINAIFPSSLPIFSLTSFDSPPLPGVAISSGVTLRLYDGPVKKCIERSANEMIGVQYNPKATVAHASTPIRP